jgi:hypothetical protein
MAERYIFSSVMVRLVISLPVAEEKGRNELREKATGFEQVEFIEEDLLPPERSSELLRLDEALTQLTRCDERKAKIVELHYFASTQSKKSRL